MLRKNITQSPDSRACVSPPLLLPPPHPPILSHVTIKIARERGRRGERFSATHALQPQASLSATLERKLYVRWTDEISVIHTLQILLLEAGWHLLEWFSKGFRCHGGIWEISLGERFLAFVYIAFI